jgi:hypothetical protein
MWNLRGDALSFWIKYLLSLHSLKALINVA